MIYRHKTTGAVIDVESTMGGDWEPVKAPNQAHAADPEAGKAEEQPATEKAVKKNGRGVRNSK